MESLIILFSVLLSVIFLHQRFKQSRIVMIIKNVSDEITIFL
jgi:hypothetical protein